MDIGRGTMAEGGAGDSPHVWVQGQQWLRTAALHPEHLSHGSRCRPSGHRQRLLLKAELGLGQGRGLGGCKTMCPLPQAELGDPAHTLPCLQGLVGPSEWLQEQLLQLLALHSDPATAARCALDLALPEERLPAAVATELSRLRLRDR